MNQIASTTTNAAKTFEVFVTAAGVVTMVEGINTSRGWSHKKTTTYITIAKAMAAYTKKVGA
jgi:hypothetical protein